MQGTSLEHVELATPPKTRILIFHILSRINYVTQLLDYLQRVPPPTIYRPGDTRNTSYRFLFPPCTSKATTQRRFPSSVTRLEQNTSCMLSAAIVLESGHAYSRVDTVDSAAAYRCNNPHLQHCFLSRPRCSIQDDTSLVTATGV